MEKEKKRKARPKKKVKSESSKQIKGGSSQSHMWPPSPFEGYYD